MAALSGIFVPNVVPYDAKGRIHEEELRRIIRWIGGKGVTAERQKGSDLNGTNLRRVWDHFLHRFSDVARDPFHDAVWS